MEDVVDSFMVRVEGSEPDADLKTSKRFRKKIANFFKKGKTRHQIAGKIQEIKARFKEVADLRDKYKVDDVRANPGATNTVDPRIINLFKDSKELVGIEKPRDELIKSLTDGNDDVSNSGQQLKVLSIFGFGGLGKTTLAKAVYDRLQTDFACRAFVSVGQSPNLKKVLMDIIRKLDQESYLKVTMLDEVQLIDELRKLLKDKRYLIVIDDMWDKNSWNILKCAWIDSNCGSRIIITTRILEVAEEADDVYKHRPLSSRISEELFYTRLSIGKCKIPYDESVELCEKILQKCGGVPLAIITLASLLASKPREDWSEVYDSIGLGHGANVHADNTRKILLYSYYDLPCYLRACLLHLSIYPEDYEIEKDTLIWQWVAEGFVHEKPGIGLFQLGEIYFNELINRSLIQPVERPYQSIIYACRVHDLVLDMIYNLSREENFVTILGSSYTQLQSSQSNARRLALQYINVNERQKLRWFRNNTRICQVRSFNALMCDVNIMPSLSSFHGLRVLAMEGCTFPNDQCSHLENLGKLLQLRYLGLLRTPIVALPVEIGDLRFLQILDMRHTQIQELPPSIGQLRRLKCLRLPRRCFGGALGWIGNLTSLEELSLPYLSLEFVEELRKLTELRKFDTLFAYSDELFEVLMKSLGNLQKLQTIEVESEHQEYGPSMARIVDYVPSRHLRHLEVHIFLYSLPGWIDPSCLPSLSHLEVKLKTVTKRVVEVLGRFAELIVLSMRTYQDGMPDIMGGGAFPKLRYFKTESQVRFLKGAMPNLEYFGYYFDADYTNSNFERDIASIGNLPRLREVYVTDDCDIRRTREKLNRVFFQAVDVHPNKPTLEIC